MKTDDKARAGLPGQALVEFVLIFPIIAMLLMAVVDGSAAWRADALARSAAMEAARWAQENPGSTLAAAEAHGLASVGSPDWLELSHATETEGAPHRYTMRVSDGSGGWKTADAESRVSDTTFTATATFDVILGSFAGMRQMTLTESASCVRATEAVAR